MPAKAALALRAVSYRAVRAIVLFLRLHPLSGSVTERSVPGHDIGVAKGKAMVCHVWCASFRTNHWTRIIRGRVKEVSRRAFRLRCEIRTAYWDGQDRRFAQGSLADNFHPTHSFRRFTRALAIRLFPAFLPPPPRRDNQEGGLFKRFRVPRSMSRDRSKRGSVLKVPRPAFKK